MAIQLARANSDGRENGRGRKSNLSQIDEKPQIHTPVAVAWPRRKMEEVWLPARILAATRSLGLRLQLRLPLQRSHTEDGLLCVRLLELAA